MSLAMKVSCLAILFVSLLFYIPFAKWVIADYGLLGFLFLIGTTFLLGWQLQRRLYPK
jgi:hypothetical protein